MKYFEVEKEYRIDTRFARSVASDGSVIGTPYTIEGDANEMIIGFRVLAYDESGLLEYVKFYPVISDVVEYYEEDGIKIYENNREEVLAQIMKEHPAGEWQNNDW